MPFLSFRHFWFVLFLILLLGLILRAEEKKKTHVQPKADTVQYAPACIADIIASLKQQQQEVWLTPEGRTVERKLIELDTQLRLFSQLNPKDSLKIKVQK